MAQTLVADAEQMMARGAMAEAVALLEAGTQRGNADAAMLAAVWHLRGGPLPRDLFRARTLLRRAVELGHVDGALMEIALTANGSGGAPDWPGACQLLRAAATRDHVAADQLRLVTAMQLDDAGLPCSIPVAEVVSEAPRVVRFPDFFSAEECAHVAMVAAALLEPARVIDPRNGQYRRHPIRTSDDATIGPAREDLVVRALNMRIAQAARTRIEQGEPLTVLRYRPGQEYRPHLDTIHGAANQRIATMIVYLNGGYGGGETHFPSSNLTITPRGGDAVLFANTLADGRPDAASRHAGLPVTRGVKWIATRWIRDQSVDPWSLA
jgi:prolyl 4-hydroxylase